MITFHYTDKGGLRTLGPIAENYNELTGEQLIALCQLFVMNEQREIADLKAMQILLQIESPKKFWKLNMHVKYEILQHIDWLFDKNGLTKQLIPEFCSLHGPASEWDNLTMAEWNACEIYYHLMVTEDDVDAQNKIIAVMYREMKPGYDLKRDPDGDARAAFNANEIDFYTEQIRVWPDEVKMAILTWFDGCRQQMKDLYPELFEGSPTKNEEKDPGMFQVIRQLSGQKYGSFKEVEQMSVHVAARELVLQIKEANEINRKK
jgi:hypothetical protein